MWQPASVVAQCLIGHSTAVSAAHPFRRATPPRSLRRDRRVERTNLSASASRIRSAICCLAMSPLSISASFRRAPTLGHGPGESR